MEERGCWGFPASAGFIIDSHVAAARERPRRIGLGNRRRFFRRTGFEIGNATGPAQRKLAKKEARPRSRSSPILRDPLDHLCTRLSTCYWPTPIRSDVLSLADANLWLFDAGIAERSGSVSKPINYLLSWLRTFALSFLPIQFRIFGTL